MKDVEPIFVGRTFDDFLFRPQHSPVESRRVVDLTMPLLPGLALALPVVGANTRISSGQSERAHMRLMGSPRLDVSAWQSQTGREPGARS